MILLSLDDEAGEGRESTWANGCPVAPDPVIHRLTPRAPLTVPGTGSEGSSAI